MEDVRLIRTAEYESWFYIDYDSLPHKDGVSYSFDRFEHQNTIKVQTIHEQKTKMSALSSRSSSWSSMSSRFSSLTPVRSRYDPYDLESRATKILKTLVSSPNTAASIAQQISPTIQFEHGDDDPVYSLQKYLSRFSDASARYPQMQLDVKEACVDEIQRKVWVRSEVTGLPDGMIKERVDMLYFDEQGVLVRSVDHQRIKRRW